MAEFSNREYPRKISGEENVMSLELSDIDLLN